MIYRQNWINKLERKLGRIAIPNLMTILVGAMAIVFLMDKMLMPMTGASLWQTLCFDRAAIFEGQIWRVFTFLFLPPSSSILWIIFSLYLYYMIGGALENYWGSFGFTLYYLLGAIGAMVSGLITGFATNEYLNLSLFFAFTVLNPNFEILLFFFIPIKMKWLAILNGVVFVASFVMSGWGGRLALLFAVLNVIVFFAPQLADAIKSLYRRWKWNRNFKR